MNQQLALEALLLVVEPAGELRLSVGMSRIAKSK